MNLLNAIRNLLITLKVFLRIDYFLCTGFVFAVMYAIYLIPSKSGGILTPMVDALRDFELTDIIFSQDLRESINTDTNIVIINTGDFEPSYIAEKIVQIAQRSPKVIALNLPYINNLPDDKLADLMEVIDTLPNVVIAAPLDQFLKNKSDGNTSLASKKLLHCWRQKKLGFTTLNMADVNTTVRTFTPIWHVENRKIPHFAIAAAQKYDSAKTLAFLSRGKSEEYINYTGKLFSFYAIDLHKIFSQSSSNDGFFADEADNIYFKDKIVLMGYIGPSIASADNYINHKYFTPMNEKYAGKTYPDMFEIVIYANIVTMILNQRPIDSMPAWLSLTIAVVLCFLNVVLFYYLHDYHAEWYDFYAKFIQLIETIVLLFLVITVFQYANYKMDLVLAVNAVLLSSDLLEIYTGSVPNITKYLFKRLNIQY